MASDEEIDAFQAKLAGTRRGLSLGFLARAGWLLTALTLPAFGLWGAAWMTKQGGNAAYECRQQKAAAGEAIGGDCRARGWLWPPQLVPWTRDEARARSDSTGDSATREDFQWATRVVAQPAEALRLAKQLDQIAIDRGIARDGSYDDGVVTTLDYGGAMEAVALLEPSRTSRVYQAKLWLGDVDGARDAALLAPESREFRGRLRRGAFLCLAGREEEGAALLRDATESSEREYSARDLAYCAESKFDAKLGVGRAALQPMLSAPNWMQGRRASVARFEGNLALTIAEDPSSSKLDVLGLLLSREEHAPKDGAYWPGDSIYDEPLRGAIADGRGTEKGADRLLKLSEEGGDLSKELAADGAAASDLGYGKTWPVVFRRLAWTMKLHAAAQRLHVGDMAGALRLARASADLAPAGFAVLNTKLLLRAGEPALALAACRDRPKLEVEAEERFVARMCLEASVRALVALERWDEALAVAVSLQEAGGSLWPRAALELRAGKRDLLDTLAPFQISDSPETTVAGWLPLAFAEEQDRAPLRRKLRAPFFGGGPWDSFALYVMGKAAPPGGDLDLWLDGGMSSATVPFRALLASRIDAAKLAGDAERVTRLQTRKAALDALVKDERSALLAEDAGL